MCIDKYTFVPCLVRSLDPPGRPGLQNFFSALRASRIGWDNYFIIDRAPTDTCVYNDNKDFSAIITEVYICKIYTTIKQGYI